MARSTKPVSNDLRWAIARMRHVCEMSTKDIARQTGVHIRTVQRVLSQLEETGRVAPRERRTTRGSVLSAENMQVCALQ